MYVPNGEPPPPPRPLVHLTSFIGRVREIPDLTDRLTPSRAAQDKGLDGAAPRLLTLTGPGGCGKTRLAAQALGLHENVNAPSLDVLIHDLGGKHLLLVLDNCEHLLKACADLALALLPAPASTSWRPAASR